MDEHPGLLRSSERIGYALLGLLAGDALLLIFLLANAIRAAVLLSAARMGQPVGQIAAVVEVFVFYAACSLAGWFFVGLPPHILVRFPAAGRAAIGLVLGPIAMLLIMITLTHGHIASRNIFAGTGILWIYSAAVSVTAFWIYIRLLQRGFRRQAFSRN